MSRDSRKQKKGTGINWSQFFSARNDTAQETSTESDTPVAAHVFSGNLLIVLGILAFIVLLSWGSIRTFLVQRAEMKQVEQNISQLQSKNNDLSQELNLWKDDNYVKQQAKARLFYVTEGETPYMVTGTDYSSSLADDTSAVALTAPQESWTETLWGSFQESAQEGQNPTGTTATPEPTASSDGASSAPATSPAAPANG